MSENRIGTKAQRPSRLAGAAWRSIPVSPMPRERAAPMGKGKTHG
ncbi:hypothetical protein [Mesorhizobium sp. M7D.F.Ca.US.005.01.1.1]|nr:hypothetical protein [Mesorhizobium sp. M7D.F.Ca.US.005.01.1.1]